MVLQQNRLGAFDPPDGSDALALISFTGVEAISELFEFEVACLNPHADVDPDALLGRNASVRLNPIDPKHPKRFFDGLVTEIRCEGKAEGGQVCTLVLRPWLWLLGLRRTQKIFHNMTVPDILTEVFEDYGFPHKAEFQQAYPVLEFTVQYNESDLDFVQRLMSEYGISYRFDHQRHSHTLILFDETDSLPMVPGDRRHYRLTDRQHRDKSEHLHDWVSGRRMTTGRVAMIDYNFTAPRRAMTTDQSRGADYAHGNIESFVYPGRYPDRADGESLARARAQQLAMGDGRHKAQGDCIGFCPGLRVVVVDHPDKAINEKTFAVLSCRHDFTAETYRTGGTETGEGDSYRGSYEFLAADRPIRPAPTPSRPRALGPQTAVVVGEGEIDCDEYGRILVAFHWDRENAKSMRCRVAQTWAGKNWGGVVIPRIGMEVVVEFIDGDPDRPLVIGCVYNADNMPPFDLPGKNMVSGMKSNSTPGGGGYNEFVFDDTKGKEEVRLHAQYNFNAVVRNNATWTTGVDETVTIGNDMSTSVGRDWSLTIGRDATQSVGRNRQATVGQNDVLTVGKDLTITAGNTITLKVGMSTIKMTKESITIKAPTVEIKAAQKFISTAGMKSEHKAGMTFDIKGGLVLINS